jgi:hypothetical protein
MHSILLYGVSLTSSRRAVKEPATKDTKRATEAMEWLGNWDT